MIYSNFSFQSFSKRPFFKVKFYDYHFVCIGPTPIVVDFCIQCGSRFEKYAKSINGIKLAGTSSDHLFNYCLSLSHRLQEKLSQTETKLDADDIEMCTENDC